MTKVIAFNKRKGKTEELTEQKAFKIFYNGAENFFVGLANETKRAIDLYEDDVAKYDRYTASTEYDKRLKEEFKRRLFEEKDKLLIAICNGACDKYEIIKVA